MCDLIAATPAGTQEHITIFGKNSDRQRNEAQAVELIARTRHAVGERQSCTYISVPQVAQTHAILISRPFWTWGAEMGANEHGVAIGNVAVHAKIRVSEQPALTGLDLLRLALLRAATAREAVAVITTLLAEFGQGGDCGHLVPSHYNNGFIVADPHESFVLETVGREWALEQAPPVRSVSNAYSIHRYDAGSEGLIPLLQQLKPEDTAVADFAGIVADTEWEHIGNSDGRRCYSTTLLEAKMGQLQTADMMRILRDHGAGDRLESGWTADCVTRRTLCLHSNIDPKSGQAVGSMISELRSKDATHWVTATAAPCISIFKPVLFDAPLPSRGLTLTDRFDTSTVWWRHEQLHRRLIFGGIASFLDDIHQERDELEEQFRKRTADVLQGGTSADRAEVIARCWADAHDLEEKWLRNLTPSAPPPDSPYILGWKRMNELAGC